VTIHGAPPDVLNIVQWNGRAWTAMPGSDAPCGGPDCVISDLSCSTATNCVYDGNFCIDDNCTGYQYFTATWNGTTWTDTFLSSFELPDRGVCAGRSFCMRLERPAIAQVTHDWGNTWDDASANLAAVCRGRAGCPTPGRLACGSPWFCVVLPLAHPALAVTWNGATWRIVRTARFHGRAPTPNLLSCGSPRNCVAIDSFQRQPVAEHWNGSTWQVTPMAPAP